MRNVVLTLSILLATLNVQEAMDKVSKLRGLPFKHPVETKEIERSGVDAFVEEALKDTYGDRLPQFEMFLKNLHLVKQNVNLHETFLKLYRSQIAAFYNPKDQTFYSIKGVSGGMEMGSDMIVIHELTHALQDQYMGLERRMKALADNHDEQMALTSLLEGEATLMMVADQLQNLGMGMDGLSTFSDSLSLFAPTMADMAGDYPPYLVHEMLFPYLDGARYLIDEMGKGYHWNRVDPLYRHPPCTTETILHPERTFKAPADFRHFLTTLLPSGWSVVFQDTLGEETWRYIFEKSLEKAPGVRAADGWDGDRVALCRRGNHNVVIWLTRWDTEKDRKEAQEGLEAYLKRFHDPYNLYVDGKSLAVISGDLKEGRALVKALKRSIVYMEVTRGYDCSEQ